jgi:hypothetical protein
VWGYLQNATLYAMAAMSRRITTSSWMTEPYHG